MIAVSRRALRRCSIVARCRRCESGRDLLRTRAVGGLPLVGGHAARRGVGELAKARHLLSHCPMAGGSREPAPEPALGHLAADGLLAIFFVAGLELQREFVAGDQRDPRRAALPVAAAVGVMAVPALALPRAQPVRAEAVGCAIPTATDIAFALAVLAVINTHLPAALRVFLLTLAVIDDLLAITIIAIF